ncbi:hypothetical protein GH714_006758 [Hevea brasiliensis]|uniref:Terpene synthase N-terminal domain-containing protein n=1 Tax=Hevea brasiliensis TaxID=3981 RepID=A0A6A6NG48_HEVBR|nr:hypothetical protein GH714_006758 [Hevea brasiliensis]
MTTQRKNICVNESYNCNLEEWLIKHNTDARWSSKHHTWNLDSVKASINWNLEWLTLDTVQLVQGMITSVLEFHDKNGIHGYLHNHKNFLLKVGMKCYLGAHVRNIVKVFIVHDGKSEKKNGDLKEKSKNADVTELASMICHTILVHPLNCSLDISYHFESEIDEILKEMSSESDDDNNDLYAIALKFRPVRKQGYNMSCDVFNKFKDSQGNLKDSLVNGHRGMLSMYEAMHLRVHGEDILDEALAFTTAHLESMPIRKGITRLEARHHLSIYEEKASCNKVLLSFAKLDFNLLQNNIKRNWAILQSGGKN